MSTRILIIAHAPLANALRDCALHVFPECTSAVIAVDVPAHEAPEDTLNAAQLLLQADPLQDTLVLTDVLGATPANVAQNARASAKLTKMAGSFPCEVWLSRGERRVNAKSIMGVMMLAAGKGVEISIETIGDQEEQAMQALIQLMNDKFGEGE